MSWSTLAYNTKVHSTTKITPFMAMFRREAKLPIDLILPYQRKMLNYINM